MVRACSEQLTIPLRFPKWGEHDHHMATTTKRYKPGLGKVLVRAGKNPRAGDHVFDLLYLVKHDHLDLVRITRDGIGADVLIELAEKLSVNRYVMSRFAGISNTTLDRRLKNHERLDQHESDRVIRYTQLWKLAVEIMGSEEAAREWLQSPEVSFSGETPLKHAETSAGSRRVEDVLNQIAYGIVT